MKSKEIEKLLIDLINIPSITGSDDENNCGKFIYDWLNKLDYFKNNPNDLFFYEIPAEFKTNRTLYSVAAFMRAKDTTPNTIILIGHFDVVDVECYAEIKSYAFDPLRLKNKYSKKHLSAEAYEDLKSGKYLFGRGSMDMKCGLAVEMSLLSDFSYDRTLFNSNILFLALADEEANASGMRGMIPFLNELKEKEKLKYCVAVNTEPSDAAMPGIDKQVIFTGTIGKLLPAFYFVGKEAHVGNYYKGVSASLMMAELVSLVEAEPSLSDEAFGECYPSWINLESRLIKKGYSVTVPNKAVAYFNCFTVTKTPNDVLKEMQKFAQNACKNCEIKLLNSYKSLKNRGYEGEQVENQSFTVITYAEVYKIAKSKYYGDFDKYIDENININEDKDLREKCLDLLEKILDISELSGPLVVVGFLPPYLPHRTTMAKNTKNTKIMSAVEEIMCTTEDKFNEKAIVANYFTGLCDLSYTGFEGNISDLIVLSENFPGWGKLFSIDVEGILALDNIPIINIGPKGKDAHKNTERVEIEYSIKIFPKILLKSINIIEKYCEIKK